MRKARDIMTRSFCNNAVSKHLRLLLLQKIERAPAVTAVMSLLD